MNNCIEDEIEQIDFLHSQSIKEYYKHNYTGGISLLTEVFQKYNSLYEQGSISLNLPYIAGLQTKLGIFNFQQGDFNKSYEWFLEELNTREKIHNNQPHEDIANALGHIGESFNKMGKYTESIDYYSQKLKMLNKLYTEPNAAIATTHRDIGVQYFHRAADMHSSDESKSQDDSPKYAEQKDHSDSTLQYFIKALKMQEKLYPAKDNDFTSEILDKIGGRYKELQKYEDSAKYYDLALLMNLRIYGQKPADTHSEKENLFLYCSVYKLVSIHKILHNDSDAMHRMIQTIELLKQHNSNPSLVIATLAKDIGDMGSIFADKEDSSHYYAQSSAMLEQYNNEHATNSTLLNSACIERAEEKTVRGVVEVAKIPLSGQSGDHVAEIGQ